MVRMLSMMWFLICIGILLIGAGEGGATGAGIALLFLATINGTGWIVARLLRSLFRRN